MKSKLRSAAIYVRVSTGGQTVENQLRELQEVAERRRRLPHGMAERAYSGARTSQRIASARLQQNAVA